MVALGDSAPAGIVTDIDHRTERPADAVGRGFLRGNLRRTLDGLHVPGAGESQRNGEHGFVAMDDVHAEDEGDAETTFLDSNALQFSHATCALQVEEAAHTTCTDVLGHVARLGGTCHDVTRNGKVELTQLLFERHLAHQVVDEGIHLVVRLVARAAGQTQQ